MCVCVCVCVSLRDEERETRTGKKIFEEKEKKSIRNTKKSTEIIKLSDEFDLKRLP